MNLILIIIINTQQNSPRNRHFISNKPLVIIKLGWILGKINHFDCNNPFFNPTSPTLPFLQSLPSSLPFPTTGSGNMCIYVNMHAIIYANMHIYERASNSTYRNILTFKSAQT